MQLEMQDIVGADSSERLSGSDFVASKDAGGADIAVHRIIGTMFDDDDPQTAVLADCADFAVIDATGLAAVGTFDVDAFVVKIDSAQTFHRIDSESAHDAVGTRDRHRQAAFVEFDSATHHTIGLRQR